MREKERAVTQHTKRKTRKTYRRLLAIFDQKDSPDSSIDLTLSPTAFEDSRAAAVSWCRPMLPS